ncbi:hypothetical protein DFJ73DRAFT_798860, partial [Zopfochytrium polystomum]
MLLDLPLPLFRAVLVHLHPHQVQMLRCCCTHLREVLRLRNASDTATDDEAGQTGSERLVNYPFALENMRCSKAINGIDVTESPPAGKIGLSWKQLGPDYLAALFHLCGFHQSVFMQSVPEILPEPGKFYGNSTPHPYRVMVDGGFVHAESKKRIEDYMQSEVARLVTSAAKTVARYADCYPPNVLFYKHDLLQWTLAADDEYLFAVLEQKKDLWMVKREVDLTQKAVEIGAYRIARKLVLSGAGIRFAAYLQKAMWLDDGALVRLLVTAAPASFSARTVLSSEDVQTHFDQKHLAAIEALLEAAPGGINAERPWRRQDRPDWVQSDAWIGWNHTVSRILKRLVDTNSISVKSAPSFLYAACSVGAQDTAAQLARFPGIKFSFLGAISRACRNGHGAVVDMLLSEAKDRGMSVQDVEGENFQDSDDEKSSGTGHSIEEMFIEAAECGDHQVIAAFARHYDYYTIERRMERALKIAKLFGHDRLSRFLLSQYTRLYVGQMLRGEDDPITLADMISSADPSVALADAILADSSSQVATLVDSHYALLDAKDTILTSAVFAASANVLAWAADRWGITNPDYVLSTALNWENIKIADWLLLHRADLKGLKWSTIHYLITRCRLTSLEVLTASPEALPKLGNTRKLDNVAEFVTGRSFIGGTVFEMSPLSVHRRSRIALALFQAGVLALPQKYDNHDVDRWMRAAFYAGDSGLYQMTVEYLASVSVPIKDFARDRCGCFGHSTGKEPIVIVALREFQKFASDFWSFVPNPAESDLACARDVHAGQVEILGRIVQEFGLESMGGSILGENGAYLPHVKTYLDEAIRNHLRQTVEKWADPKKDNFTNDFLSYVLFIDDGPLFADYTAILGPFCWLNPDRNLTALIEKAIDLDACNVLASVPPSAPLLQTSALERAMRGNRSRTVELILSRRQSKIDLAESAMRDLVLMTPSESWLNVLATVVKHSSLINFTFPPRCFPIHTRTILYSSKSETGFLFRKRALEIVRHHSPIFFDDADADFDLSYRVALGRVTAQSLLAAVPVASDRRGVVRSCVATIAQIGGDPRSVVDLLKHAAADDAERLAGVQAALECSVGVGPLRPSVADAVLRYAVAEAGLPRDELATVVREKWRALSQRSRQ